MVLVAVTELVVFDLDLVVVVTGTEPVLVKVGTRVGNPVVVTTGEEVEVCE